MVRLNEAIDLVLAAARPLGAERVTVLEALGRAAAAAVVSAADVPSFDNSAMDGFAVRGADLELARREGLPVVAEIPAGTVADRAARAGPGGAHHDRGTHARRAPTRSCRSSTSRSATAACSCARRRRRRQRAPRRRGRAPRRRACCRVARRSARPRSACWRRSASSEVDCGRAARGWPSSPPAASWCRSGSPLGPGQIRNSNSFAAWARCSRRAASRSCSGIARRRPRRDPSA